MTEEENTNYQALSKIQKDFVDALKEVGFTHKYMSTWELLGWAEIKISRLNKWSDLLREVYKIGRDEERFGIQRVLGITH